MIKQLAIMLSSVVMLMCSMVSTASATEGILFQCALSNGGELLAMRTNKEVTLKVIDGINNVVADVTNPVDETGLANIEKDKGGTVDSLDLLNDTVQYSIIVEHNGLANVSSLAVIANNQILHYPCDPTSVVNNLGDKKITKGIFRP